jgi:bifunctional non-homologous end joining protein LigD
MGVTKRDLAGYYRAVAGVILPRIEDRPIMMLRCPSGAGGKCFYQKHAKGSVPDVVPRVTVPEKDGKARYLYVDGVTALMGLVQMGVLELHVWGARRDRLDRPDRLIFDLDPDQGLPFGRVGEGALQLRERLTGLGLDSFPKLTGGKGLHVVTPVVRRTEWDEARAFARAVAERMATDHPGDYTTDASRAERSGRIYIDYLRNAPNATTIADYSPRARDGAPVAVPLAWDEVDPRAEDPPRFGLDAVLDRLEREGDPWSGFDGLRQGITREMKDAVGAAG